MVELKASRFNPPRVSSQAALRLQQAARHSPTIQCGESNEAVRALQQALIDLRDPEISIPSGPTGNYLMETATAVMAFQRKYGLQVDAIVGPETLGALDRLNTRLIFSPVDDLATELESQFAADKLGAMILSSQLQSVRPGPGTGSVLGPFVPPGARVTPWVVNGTAGVSLTAVPSLEVPALTRKKAPTASSLPGISSPPSPL